MINKTHTVYKDPNIASCLAETVDEAKDLSTFYRHERFRKAFSDSVAGNISWDYYCDAANKTGVYHYACVVLVSFLENGFICGSNSSMLALKQLFPYIKSIAEQAKTHPVPLFCKEEIADLIIFRSPRTKTQFFYAKVPCANPVIRDVIKEFGEAARYYSRWIQKDIIYHFPDSLGEHLSGIHEATDFDENTFWGQINYYKHLYKNDQRTLFNSILMVCNFYRWLVNTNPDHDYFDNAFHMNRSLLFSSRLPELIKKNYYVTILDVKSPPVGHDNLCFILKNMGHLSTKLTNDDFFTATLSPLEEKLYKDLVIRYLVSASSITVITWAGQLGYIREGMHMIEELKRQPDYPNPDLKRLSTQEAVFLRNFYYDDKIRTSTLNNKIGALRRFLDWCNVGGLLSFDDMFFDYLRQYEEPPQTTGHAVPQDDLVKIHDYIVKKSENEYMWKLLLYVFHLLLDTDFRVNHILHLDTECIAPSIKQGEFILRSNTKVTHDVRPHTFVITEATRRLIIEAIDYTDELRNECTDDNMRDYIFIYKGTSDSIRLIAPGKVRNMLKEACDSVGVPRYSPANLRDTYMTNSFEYIQRHGKSDIEMRVFSKHKKLDTTKNHYIEQNLEKMLEATYGVDLGGVSDINADEKVVDRIPDDLRTAEHDVQDGCGKCKSDSCFAAGPAPCLICSDFITTVEYERFFISAIDKIDRMIKATSCRHDIEDLVLIKTLYVKFLEAIYKRKETENDN